MAQVDDCRRERFWRVMVCVLGAVDTRAQVEGGIQVVSKLEAAVGTFCPPSQVEAHRTFWQGTQHGCHHDDGGNKTIMKSVIPSTLVILAYAAILFITITAIPQLAIRTWSSLVIQVIGIIITSQDYKLYNYSHK